MPVLMMKDCEHIAVLAWVLLQPYMLLSYYVVADALLLLPAFSLVLLPPSLLVLMLPVAVMIGGDHVTAQADCLEQSPYQAASYCNQHLLPGQTAEEHLQPSDAVPLPLPLADCLDPSPLCQAGWLA